MNLFHRTAFIFCCALLLSGQATADSNDTTESNSGPMPVINKVGKAIAKGGNAAAGGIERGAKATGKVVNRGAKAAGNGIEHGVHATEKKVGITSNSGKASSASSLWLRSLLALR